MWILRFPGFFFVLERVQTLLVFVYFLGCRGVEFSEHMGKIFRRLRQPQEFQQQYPITPPRSHCSSRRGEGQRVREHLDGKGTCNAQKTRHGFFKMNWKLDPILSESDRSGSQLPISREARDSPTLLCNMQCPGNSARILQSELEVRPDPV